ncbi:MAG: hypothetical protein GX560_03525 [Deinococcales bacterium]|nr:hypothetical protein [Deinococcales bacterium]
MNRLLLRVATAAVLIASLAACSPLTPPERMTVRLDPVGDLGYEVDNSGAITVTTRALAFQSSAGSPAATITGAEVNYYDGDGVWQGGWNSERNGLSVFVPAGFACEAPDAVMGCSRTSPGSFPAPGQENVLTQSSVQFLPSEVVERHLVASMDASVSGVTMPGWYGEFTFHGYDAMGEFEITKTFFIAAPN